MKPFVVLGMLVPLAFAMPAAARGQTLSHDVVPHDVVPQDEGPDGLTATDWPGIQAAYEANRPAIDANEERGALYPLTIDTIAQQAYLKASNPDAIDRFGWSLAISGDTVVVGAYGEDSAATGVDGNQDDDSAPESGAAYVFVRDGATWSQQAYLKASNAEAGDTFGASVSVSGDTIVVGANSDDSSAVGVNGDESDNSAPTSGAAYVFVREGKTWSQQAYLKASNTEANDQFGASVSVSGDTIVVGARAEDSSVKTVNGNQADNSAIDAGAVYVFVRDGTTWSQQAYLKPTNTGAADLFGDAVSVSGDTIVVGTWREDSIATGVDGDQSDDSTSFAGAAYVIDLNHPWKDLGFALAGTAGEPVLTGEGTLIGGEPATLTLSAAKPFSPSFLVISNMLLSAPFKGGTLVPLPSIVFSISTDGFGSVVFSGPTPSGLPPVFTHYFQFWIADAGGPFGFAASNGLAGTTP